MGRWWDRLKKDRGRGNPPRIFGPATQFAAGTGCYSRSALPSWVTDPTDEQPTVDPWADEGPETDDADSVGVGGEHPTPPNRSKRFPKECGTDRGYGWKR
jgi:hypothetical protein